MGSYLPLITGGGGALVVLAIGLWLVISGTLHTDLEFKAMVEERDFWRDAATSNASARDTERRIATETAQAGQVTNQLIHALTEIAAQRSGRTSGRRQPPGLTPGDLGLGGGPT